MRCPRCPVAEGLPCLGEKAPPLCRDVESGMPGRAEQLIGLAEGQPSMLEKAANLAKAVIGHVADAGRIAPPEVQAARKAECFACSHHDHQRDRCQFCGCTLMNLKRSWASERCPLPTPKWGPV